VSATPSGPIANPPPPMINSPIFMPDALPAATVPIYPGLGQAQEHAGLHTPTAWWTDEVKIKLLCDQLKL